MEDKKPRRGRPIGSGRWKVPTRVTRVPADLDSRNLQVLLEFAYRAILYCQSPIPYKEDCIRFKAVASDRKKILEMAKALGITPF